LRPGNNQGCASAGANLSGVQYRCGCEDGHSSGAKAGPFISAIFGTTEVVPCYKALSTLSFSARCEVVPCYKTLSNLSFSAVCEVAPFHETFYEELSE
jgi:hypothetical protein